tara:strand:+ start:1687 stop:2346 length:660 start_codon:yes stop_codon:yes gene_type:complete
MAGLFDLHLLQGMQAGVKEYLDSEVSFKELFKGVSDDLLGSWFNELQRQRPTVKAAFSPGADDFPVIAVQLEAENTDTPSHPLGRYSHELDDGRRVEKVLLTQRVSVTILSKHPEITRCLHVICRATATRLTKPFLKFYDDVKFMDAADLAPDENLLAEELGIYVRRQRYEALSYADVPEIEVSAISKPWQVGIFDATGNDNFQIQLGASSSGKVDLVD